MTAIFIHQLVTLTLDLLDLLNLSNENTKRIEIFDCCQEVTKVKMGEHFCLKWNNHQENLTGIMTKLLDEEKFVDVSLVCEMKTFKAHQTVLSACSPYFQQVLEENTHPHPIIILRDVKKCEMAALLQYMYRGEVNVRDHELPTFLHTARELQIRGLSDNKKGDTLMQRQESPQASSPCPQSLTPAPLKRRRVSSSNPDSSPNDRHMLECQQSSPLPIICKSNPPQKPSSSVSTPTYSDNLSDIQYVESSTPSSAPPAIKQELDGVSTQSDEPFHGLAHHMSSGEHGSQKGADKGGGLGDQREWNVEFSSDNRSYHSQKVELPKVPLPLTQSFSSQLQAPPVPELFPCKGKVGKRDSHQQQQQQNRPKDTPGPSFSHQQCQQYQQTQSQPSHVNQQQPVSVIRNSVTTDSPTPRKGGRFRPGWMDNYGWLQYDENLNTMFCKTCRKWSNTVPDIRTSFVEGNANFRLEIVNHHDKSKAHRLCVAKEEESIPRLDPIVCEGLR